MTDHTLVIGTKNLSSWSLRAWLMMRATGTAFNEVLIPLDTETSHAEILHYSPSGLVPVLLVNGSPVWESIAIGEYLAETFPKVRLWPENPQARMHARSISAEMHAGFAALRCECPMDMHARKTVTLSSTTVEQVRRIEQLWREARGFAGSGDFLYGHFTIADAMYAPVVSRFVTYGIDVSPESQRYRDAIWAYPPFAEWYEAAKKGPK